MSAKLIVLIIGLVLTLFALLFGRKPNKNNRKVAVPIGIVGLLMMIYGSYSSDLVNYNTQIEQVSIGNKLKIDGEVKSIKVVSPLDQDSIDCRIVTMGVYPSDHTKDVWVLIRPSDDRYYPQSDHTNTSYKRDGEWQVVTRFGGDLGEAYDLIAYETDEVASAFFSTTITKWKENENYPGLKLSEIPSGAIEVDRIVVYSAKNCRGVF